jgi:glycosyltransferase involved in cell wall biosynthesis
LANVDHAPVLAFEAELVRRADLIVAASETLAARLPSCKTILLPHGVDYDLFSTPAEPAPDLPSGGPVAGYYGSIASWLDMKALSRAARKLPAWQFVLVGPVSTDVSELRQLPNVSFLGPRAHRDLPRYVQHWTVSLLPFAENAQITACNPLKLREYLAAGTPIVSTPFPAVSEYRDLVEIAPADEFGDAICRAGEDRARDWERRARVRHESWGARATDLARHLEQL